MFEINFNTLTMNFDQLLDRFIEKKVDGITLDWHEKRELTKLLRSRLIKEVIKNEKRYKAWMRRYKKRNS